MMSMAKTKITNVEREAFIFKSEDRMIVLRTSERLNSLGEEKTYYVEFDEYESAWFVSELEDLEDF